MTPGTNRVQIGHTKRVVLSQIVEFLEASRDIRCGAWHKSGTHRARQKMVEPARMLETMVPLWISTARIADAPHCISQGMSARPCTAARTHPLLDGKPRKLLNVSQMPCPSSLEWVQAPGVKREAQLHGVPGHTEGGQKSGSNCLEPEAAKSDQLTHVLMVENISSRPERDRSGRKVSTIRQTDIPCENS